MAQLVANSWWGMRNASVTPVFGKCGTSHYKEFPSIWKRNSAMDNM